MATTESTNRQVHTSSATGARTPHDVRGLWRVGLAALPTLAKGIEYLLSPVDGGAPFRETVAAFDDLAPMVAAVENDPVQLVAGLLFLAGIVIGLPVLGVALWRSRAVPVWLAFAVIIGAGTHPFIPGHVAQGVGLLVAAVGFTGASLALLRTPNEEFDLASSRHSLLTAR